LFKDKHRLKYKSAVNFLEVLKLFEN